MSASSMVVVPLVTVGLGLFASIHHLTFDSSSRYETVVDQAFKETGYRALTSFARTLLGHRGVRKKKSAKRISTARVSSACVEDQGVNRLHHVALPV